MQKYPRMITMAEIRQLVGRDDPTILEIGCNDGEDSQRFLNEFPGIRLYCFEPDPRAITKFHARVNDPRCVLTPAALSDTDGDTVLYQSGGYINAQNPDWDKSSSIFRPTGHLKMSPEIDFNKQTVVDTLKLDSWIAVHPEIDVIDFAWIDAQGAEKPIFQGGWTVAFEHRVRYIFSEFYQTPQYEGQLNLDQLLQLLPKYKLLATYENNFLAKNMRL